MSENATLNASQGDALSPANPYGKTVYTTDQVISALTRSWAPGDTATRTWAGGTVTYAFPTSAPANIPPSSPAEAAYLKPMSEWMQTRATNAFEIWDSFIGLNLELSSPATNPYANVTFNYANATYGGGTYAYVASAQPVLGDRAITGSQIWFNSGWSTHDQDSDLGFGGYGFLTYLHEIGHSLGLSHPGFYNGGSPTYAADAMFAQDTRQYSIMSYFGGYDPAASGWRQDGTYANWLYASTPMLYDVAAAQAKYGADMMARAGATVYGSNTGVAWWDGVNQAFDFSYSRIFTIWDPSGIDTLSGEGFGAAQRIDLNGGAYSSMAGLTENVAVAFNAVIENAIGGWGSDVIVGTIWNNVLDGGGGFDIVSYSAAAGAVTVALDAQGAPQATGAGFDTLLNFEGIEGSPYADTLTGDGGANTLIGGGGDDALRGGAGVDTAAWAAPRSGFAVRTSVVGGELVTRVADSQGAAGVDGLAEIEATRFGTATLALAGAQQNHQSQFDASPFDDVLIRQSSTGKVSYIDMSETGAGATGSLLASLPAGWQAVGSADFTGDGRAEIIVRSSTGGLYHVNTASGTAQWGTVSAGLTSGYTFVGGGDFTKDAVSDVVVRSGTGFIQLAEMNAGGTFDSWRNVANLGTDWRAVNVGDLDRDGFSDVVVQRIADGLTYYVNMDGGGFSGWGAVSGATGQDWIARESADLNGDGYFDVVYQNQSTGQIWWQDMAGGSGQGFKVVATLPGWQVKGTGDYDNDGYADILVQNPTDGAARYADLDAGVFAGWKTVGGGLGADWVAV